MAIAVTPRQIHLATDHAGFALKEVVHAWLTARGYQVVDHGATSFDPADNFPDFIALAAAAVSADPDTDRAIIFGGSGQGEAMLANRYSHVRAGVYYGGESTMPALVREHNDANVLSIGARFVTEVEAQTAILTWLETPASSEEKYHHRIAQVEELTGTK